ncbi:MAG: hypothetical protein ACM359_11465 [Bacillota bacterium]
MFKLLEYYGRFESVRGSFRQLPAWARLLLLIVATPGIVLLGLSILAFLVSLLALLVLTVPVYRVLMAVAGRAEPVVEREQPVEAEMPPSSGRRHIDVTIIDEPRA